MKKLILSVMLSVITALSSASGISAAATGNSGINADLNSDGVFNVADVVRFQMHISRKLIIDEDMLACADMNGDGNVDVFDLVLMKRKLIGVLYQLPEEDNEAAALREKYPEYFDLDTFKGLELYVFQTVPDNYRCVLTEGTNRLKTDEEIEALFLNSTNVDDMKAILSYYDIPETNIFVIPWQSPVWEYAYKIDSAYCEKLREMFFGKNETISPSFDSKSVKSVSISSFPKAEVYERKYTSYENINKVISYLNGLHLEKDFPEKNPGAYDGMTWDIRLEFENGDNKTIYLCGNMFYCDENGDWFKMRYEEAIAFDDIVYNTPDC